jgi:lipid II:glycine glycyltransferase (peptidoglycan interpeptide bridge formation enzyme)
LLTKVCKGAVCYAQHTLIADGNQTRGLFSATRFRNEQLDKKTAANANRFLHWKEMEYLHRCGYKIYDWGGISSDELPTSVDAFKLEFKGRVCVLYNIFIGNTIKGKTTAFILKNMRRLLY